MSRKNNRKPKAAPKTPGPRAVKGMNHRVLEFLKRTGYQPLTGQLQFKMGELN